MRGLSRDKLGVLLRQCKDVLKNSDREGEHVLGIFFGNLFVACMGTEVSLFSQDVGPVEKPAVDLALGLEIFQRLVERLARHFDFREALQCPAAKYSCGGINSVRNALLCILDVPARLFRNAGTQFESEGRWPDGFGLLVPPGVGVIPGRDGLADKRGVAGGALNQDDRAATVTLMDSAYHPRVDPRRAVMAIDDDVAVHNPFPGWPSAPL